MTQNNTDASAVSEGEMTANALLRGLILVPRSEPLTCWSKRSPIDPSPHENP